jgi:hypothetical protein
MPRPASRPSPDHGLNWATSARSPPYAAFWATRRQKRTCRSTPTSS